MIVDRISSREEIKKNFIIYETIYYDSLKGAFSQSASNYALFSIRYDLKFAIFHHSYGHFVAYSKIKGEWYLFDDCAGDEYAEKKNPPLNNLTDIDIYSICFYYVKYE